MQKFNCLPYNPELNEFAKELRKNMTLEEKKLWYCFLSKHELRFLRQKVIDNFIVDFYCSKVRLVIELDGSHHFTDNGIEYDKVRTEILSAYGIRVIRFINSDINYNFENVCNMINEVVKTLQVDSPTTSWLGQIPQSVATDSPLHKGAKKVGVPCPPCEGGIRGIT